MLSSRVYLISKWGDVALGLSTGVFAYYLYERKLHRTDEDSLVGLIKWKLDQRQHLAAAQARIQAQDDNEKREWEQAIKNAK
ncbi:Nce101p [Sporobolomyces koalae]|uniref:Nce101p n=1 Tax=Sporobolomyces koalae TaxID=500713 RepID=UPI00317D5ADB